MVRSENGEVLRGGRILTVSGSDPARVPKNSSVSIVNEGHNLREWKIIDAGTSKNISKPTISSDKHQNVKDDYIH